MTSLTGQLLGRYQILEQIGEGGMSVVYKAFDTRLERDVSVKIIRKGAFPPEDMERILERFDREAKALARLSHRNIVKVFDYGEYDGAPYLVMEYVPGGTLKQRLLQQKNGPLPWQEACHFLVAIADALQYSHDRGIIHRDVKPSNILISNTGQPMLTDFGIVKLQNVQEARTLTGTGFGVGTPEYMAPEQWIGKVTPQCDQYSFGVVLYEMLTGKKPYQADTAAAILLKQATQPPPNPGQYTPDLPTELEDMVLKVLSSKPEDRFPAMNNLADALEALPGMTIAGSKVKKRKPARKVRIKTDQQVPARVSHALLWILIPSLILLLGGSGFLAWQYFRAGGNREASPVNIVTTSNPPVSITSSPTVTAMPSPSRTPLYTSTPTPLPTVPQSSLLLVGMPLPLPRKTITQDNIKGLTQIALWGSGPIGQVRWTSDGKYLVVASTNGLTFYDAGNYSIVGYISTPANDDYFSDDGLLMAFLKTTKSLEIQNVVDQTTIATITIPANTGDISSVAFPPHQDDMVAIGTTMGSITLWNLPAGTLHKTFFAPTMYVNSLAFSWDENELASGSGSEQYRDFFIRLWNVDHDSQPTSAIDKQPTHTIPKHKTPVTRLAYSPDGLLLASASGDGEIYFWQVMNGAQNFNGFSTPVNYSTKSVGRISFSQDGSLFAYSLNDAIYIRKSSDGELADNLSVGDNKQINSLAFSTDGRTLASGSDDCTVRLWNITDGTLLKTIGGNSGYISTMAFSKDGSIFASASADKTIHFWHATNGDNYLTITVREVPTALVFSPKGNTLACGLSDGRMLFIDTETGEYTGDTNLRFDPEHKNAVVFMRYSDDGYLLVTADLNGIVRVDEMPTRANLYTQDVGPANVFSMSPDFTSFAANKYRSLNIWKLENGSTLVSMKGQVYNVISLAYSPDGQTILSGAPDNTIQVSSATDGGKLASFTDSITPSSLFFSPDGSLLASMGGGSVNIWSMASKTVEKSINLSDNNNSQLAAAFSPDGAYLVFGLEDGTIQIWGAP